MICPEFILRDENCVELLLDRDFNVTRNKDLDFYYVYNSDERQSWILKEGTDGCEELIFNSDVGLHNKILYGVIRSGYEL